MLVQLVTNLPKVTVISGITTTIESQLQICSVTQLLEDWLDSDTSKLTYQHFALDALRAALHPSFKAAGPVKSSFICDLLDFLRRTVDPNTFTFTAFIGASLALSQQYAFHGTLAN